MYLIVDNSVKLLITQYSSELDGVTMKTTRHFITLSFEQRTKEKPQASTAALYGYANDFAKQCTKEKPQASTAALYGYANNFAEHVMSHSVC